MNNLGGCVSARNGKWRIILYWNEGKTRRTNEFNIGLSEKGNKRKAETLLQERIAEHTALEPEAFISRTVRFNDYAQQWLNAVGFEVAPTTFITYEGIVRRHITPYFSRYGFTVAEIKRDDVQNFYHWLFVSDKDHEAISATMLSRVHTIMKKWG